jgi:hypothetical protein
VRSTSASKAAITAVRASADSKVLMTISRGWLDNGSILARTSATLPEATTIAQLSRYYVSGYEKSTTTQSQTQLMQIEPPFLMSRRLSQYGQGLSIALLLQRKARSIGCHLSLKNLVNMLVRLIKSC